MEVYSGVENIFSYRQDNPIIAANDPNGILFGMNEEPLTYKEGKRIFQGITNISDKTGMYPNIKEDKEVKDLFLRTTDK